MIFNNSNISFVITKLNLRLCLPIIMQCIDITFAPLWPKAKQVIIKQIKTHVLQNTHAKSVNMQVNKPNVIIIHNKRHAWFCKQYVFFFFTTKHKFCGLAVPAEYQISVITYSVTILSHQPMHFHYFKNQARYRYKNPNAIYGSTKASL